MFYKGSHYSNIEIIANCFKHDKVLIMSSQKHTSEFPLDDLIYQQLKIMANKLMKKERNNHTLSPTDLVHEAFVKLSVSGVSFADQKHYFRTLARQMRRVLIDYARNKSRKKNKGKINNVIYTDSLGLLDTSIDFTHISDAIDELENMDANSAEAIDLIYFSALPQAQASDYLDVSLATLERNLKFGRAFINEYIYNLGLFNGE